MNHIPVVEDLLECVHRRTVKMFRGLEHLCYGARLREQEVVSLEKTPGRPWSTFHYLKSLHESWRGTFDKVMA